MSKGFIPQVIALLKAWLLNLKTVLPVQGLLVGQTGPQIIVTQDNIQAGIDKIDLIVTKKAEYNAAVHDFHEWQKAGGTGLGGIRKNVETYKADPGYTPGIGGIMRTEGTDVHVDPTSFKPDGKSTPQAGYNLITFFKHGVDLMSIEYRVKGTVDFIHLGNVQDSGFHHVYVQPVVTPPIVPAPTSADLEYRLTGIIHDVLIGHPSDIFGATFMF
jgi:hypothetical protein